MSYYVYITQKDDTFIADVPALPGCRTIGRSEEEVIENIRDVVRGYFQSLRRSNKAVPKVKVVKVSGRFPYSSTHPSTGELLPSGEGTRVGSPI